MLRDELGEVKKEFFDLLKQLTGQNSCFVCEKPDVDDTVQHSVEIGPWYEKFQKEHGKYYYQIWYWKALLEELKRNPEYAKVLWRCCNHHHSKANIGSVESLLWARTPNELEAKYKECISGREVLMVEQSGTLVLSNTEILKLKRMMDLVIITIRHEIKPPISGIRNVKRSNLDQNFLSMAEELRRRLDFY